MISSEEFADFLETTAETLSAWPSFREYPPQLRSLAAAARLPFSVAVIGRMKTGKSTLINSLIGEELAISGVEEATATINWIGYGEGEQLGRFQVHQKNGAVDSLPRTELLRFSGKSAETLALVRQTAWLRFFAQRASLKQVEIIDTPGTGSAVAEHEEVATEYLDATKIEASIAAGNKADAFIYVVSPVGRESDLANLDLIEGSRLPNSDPYNSVCVLHKWDALEDPDPKANAKLKAARLAEQLKGRVMTAIPVSGPIALAVKAAPDVFFRDLIAVLAKTAATDLDRALLMDTRWDRDDERRRVRALWPLPWASFCLLCRQLTLNGETTPSGARLALRAWCGIDDLEQLLEAKFFSRTRILKLAGILQRARTIMEPLIREMQRFLDLQREAVELLQNDIVGSTPRAKQWIAEQIQRRSSNIEIMEASLLELDRQWLEKNETLERLQLDLKTLQFISERPTRFPGDDAARLTALCDHLADFPRRSQLGASRPVALDHLHEMINRYRAEENRARPKEQIIFAHVVHRLEQAAQHC